MAVKLTEQTNGSHIYMRLRLDSGRVEEIDAYTTEKGWHYESNNLAEHTIQELVDPSGNSLLSDMSADVNTQKFCPAWTI